jgi:hypothetical protein
LGLREVWDLPGNLIREYSSEMGRQGMHVQTVSEESPARLIFRGMVSFTVGFTLVYLVYCLVDTFLNFGKTLYQGRSVWNLLYLHPTALAYSVGAAILAAKFGKRKVWLSALAAFSVFTLFYRIWAATYLAQRTSATQNFNFDLFIVPLIFSTITGILVGGVIGLVQHGWKKAMWFALAGVLGFYLGWLAEFAVNFFLMQLCPYTGNPSQLVVGDIWYFMYFVLPVIFYGGIVGLCMGVATAGVQKRLLLAALR